MLHVLMSSCQLKLIYISNFIGSFNSLLILSVFFSAVADFSHKSGNFWYFCMTLANASVQYTRLPPMKILLEIAARVKFKWVFLYVDVLIWNTWYHTYSTNLSFMEKFLFRLRKGFILEFEMLKCFTLMRCRNTKHLLLT